MSKIACYAGYWTEWAHLNLSNEKFRSPALDQCESPGHEIAGIVEAVGTAVAACSPVCGL